jgi:glycosyltransferase involved in cell wall biosynthesis
VQNIKISIITSCFNSDKTIAYCLHSVFSQTYNYIEHILIDGGSNDCTVEILNKHKNKKKKIIIANNTSIYAAINLGISKSTGDYIIILNSDDILNSKYTIENLIEIIKKNKEQVYLGNIVYFNKTSFNSVNRYYSAEKFKTWQFILGNMPPHPGAIIHKSIAKKILYNDKYKIASDFNFFVETLYVKKIPFKYINLVITRMRTGGVSGKNLLAHFTSTKEIYKSLKSHNINASYLLINLRYFIKSFQFFFKKFRLSEYKIDKYHKKLVLYDFNIINNIKLLNFKKDFVLSALNLAWLGSYCNDDVKTFKNLIQWPDGVFARKISPVLKKIPGRDLLKNIVLPKIIKKIVVLGELPSISNNYLKEKFKIKIYNIKLPYGDIKKIIKNFKYKIKKNEIILITLPTPKQEQIAEYLISKNKNYKIICIGGSINIVSGYEKAVPNELYLFEFIWRLRYETLRRLKRLFVTFFHYYKGLYYTRKFNNLSYRIITD